MTLDAFKVVAGYDETFSHNADAELDARLTVMSGGGAAPKGRTWELALSAFESGVAPPSPKGHARNTQFWRSSQIWAGPRKFICHSRGIHCQCTTGITMFIKLCCKY
jgi:hypothetical protein